MIRLSLEKRVEMLESQVAELQTELRQEKNKSGKDWRRTIGAFTDDEGMKGLLQEAMQIREADRKKARSKSATKRKPVR